MSFRITGVAIVLACLVVGATVFIALRPRTLTDEDLKRLGVDRATVERDENLRRALADGVAEFEDADFDGYFQAFNRATEISPSLPGSVTLIARMVTADRPGKKAVVETIQGAERESLLRLLEGQSQFLEGALRPGKLEAAARKEALEELVTTAEALVALSPKEAAYRFQLAMALHALGDVKRAQEIMDEIAPRNDRGFAKAHVWQADQLLSPDRPLTNESLDAAEAHLLLALQTSSEPNEIHRRLGELYYYRYVRYNVRDRDPFMPNKEIFLAKAADHLEKVAPEGGDAKLRLDLAEIHGLQGKTKQAEQEVNALIANLEQRLADVPDDVEVRLSLARAHRMVRQFEEAAKVLGEELKLRPNVRLDQELSSIFYFQAMDLLQRRADAFAEHFELLKKSYRIYPANNFVVKRFVEALTSVRDEEAEAARAALRDLADADDASGSLAPLLLAFDARKLGRTQEADQYIAKLREAKPDATPEVIAGMAAAALGGRVKSLNAGAVNQLFETALDAWPNDPDLLAVRAQQQLMLRQNAAALSDLQKALEKRPDDVKFHEMISVTYRQLGQTEKAKEHEERAAELRAMHPPATAK